MVCLVSTGYSEWRKTVAMINTCTLAPADWPQNHFRYIQLYIDSQRLREPIFDGRYFINLGWEFGRNPLQLRIIQAGSPPNYAPTTLRPNFGWDDGFPNLMMQDNRAEMAFVSKSNSHYMFPFDSARFDEAFTFEFPTPLDIQAVLLSNRVAGFYMPCDTMTVHTQEGGANISFELKRNPLIVYTAVLLLVVAALFAILIALFLEAGPLPGALASYFFAVWSIRALFGLTVEGFPTLFDFGIVLLASLIPLLLFLRVLGLPHALLPVGRYGRNLVRMLEGRELLSASAAESADTNEMRGRSRAGRYRRRDR
jgi:hypothetical protein